MFENIFKGFSFIRESFRLISKDSDLIKPSLYSIFFGIFFTVIAGITLFISNLMSTEIFYIIAFLVLIIDYYISYFFTGMTAFLVYDYFKDGDATM